MKVNLKNWPKKGYRRKINIQIDPWDSWNLDNTLAQIIYPCLVQLKATKHGVPGDLVNDVGGEDYAQQGSFDFYKETHDDAWKIGAKRWDEILDKMIWSFEQVAKGDYDEKYHHGRGEYDCVKTDKTFPHPITGKVEAT